MRAKNSNNRRLGEQDTAPTHNPHKYHGAQMSLFVVITLLAIVIAALFGFWLKTRQERNIGFPYLRTPALFSDAERAFLEVLEQAVGEQYRVFGKVHVADVIAVQPDKKNSLKRIAYKRIKSRRFDFVVCSKLSLSVVCAVELDDKNPPRKNQEARDTILRDVCESVSLPLLRIPVKNVYPIASVRTSFLAALGIPDATAFAMPTQRA